MIVLFVEKFEATPIFRNGYELVNGVKMHHANPTHFRVPPDVIKKHIRSGHFVELRIDSPRFSVHEDSAEKCSCPSCNGELRKPILRHDHPASLVPLPKFENDLELAKVSILQLDRFGGHTDRLVREIQLHAWELGVQCNQIRDDVTRRRDGAWVAGDEISRLV